MHTLDTGPAQEVDTVAESVEVVEYHAAYTGLNYQFGAFKARRRWFT